AAATHAAGLKFGIYYSIWDWHDPDAQPGGNYDAYFQRMKTSLQELLTNYGEVTTLWFDGNWDENWTEARSDALTSYLRSIKPDIILNNRVGTGSGANMVDLFGDYDSPEQEFPTVPIQTRPWESCGTIT